MKIEALTISVGYADFLQETLPHNLHHFDRLLVVTSYEDKQTQNICRRLSVECHPTDVMYSHGDPFNKGRAIDFGLGFLTRNDWIVHLDADIFLPPTTRRWIETAQPDPQCIYGIDRVNCVGYANWRRFIDDPLQRHQHRQHCIVTPPPFPMGGRISLANHAGFIPIGFFQMWHGQHARRYPLAQGDAEHTDVLHALQWPTKNRRLLPEIIAVHLESEPSKIGTNWRGRQSRPFAPFSRDPQGSASHHTGYGTNP